MRVKPSKKFYVYSYSEPGSDTVFYIGKGTKNRAWGCRRASTRKSQPWLYNKLKTLENAGIEVQVDILFETDDQQEALAVPASCGRISRIGTPS